MIIPAPTIEGLGTISAIYKGEHIKGSPIPISSSRKPYARIEFLEDRGKTCSVQQQYLFKIVASPNVTMEHLEVIILNEETNKPIPFRISMGEKPEIEDYDDPNEDDEWKEKRKGFFIPFSYFDSFFT